MANRKIICDKTEIILLDESNYDQVHALTYDQIKEIRISLCHEYSWFKKIPSAKIEIFTTRFTEPLVFFKSKNRPYFEEYKMELKKFATNNRITFNDSTAVEDSAKDYQTQAF